MSEVIHQASTAGSAVWFGDAIYTFKATTETTNGSLTFVEASVPPGGGPPPHIHPATDESFFILAGQLEFLNGDKTFLAAEGDFVFVPRGTRHRFRNVGVHVARLLFMFTPAAMEGFFQEIGQYARAGEAPVPLTPRQLQQIVELAPKYNLLLAPNPAA